MSKKSVLIEISENQCGGYSMLIGDESSGHRLCGSRVGGCVTLESFDVDVSELVSQNNVAVCYWDESGAGRSCCFVPESLKPLRTEAERKHEAVLESICAVLEMAAQDYKREDEAKLIYEAIAAGKIPGVKLDD